MRKGFFARLALTNIRKNRKVYYPYLLTAIITTAMLYIICSLSSNPSLGSDTLMFSLQLGVFVTSVFSVVFLFYTNSFLLISDAGNAVVIDPAAEVQEYDKILKEHGGKLSLILCTHGHYDHVGSAGVLSREWGAKLYCEPADCRGTQLLPLKGSDSGYEEGEVIPLDELRFTVWHTPGHTEGSVVLLCENYLFVGDTVFQGSIGRTDLEGGDSRKMDESLRKFAALPVPAEAQVLPGHGDFSTFGQEATTNFYIKNALRNA